jgi:uncharacterized protein YggE
MYMIEIPNDYVKNLYKALLVFLAVLSVFYAVRILSEFRMFKNADMGFKSITLSGHGEVSAVPDLANVSFTIKKDAKTVKEAQEGVAVVEKASLDFLKENKVEEKDIKTINASFNPKYEYRYSSKGILPCTEYGCPPRPGSNVIVGYEAYENITVKVRNTDDVGKIMQGLGGLGVSDLNGPNFSIDDEDALKAEAKKEAIDDARAKAKVLAKNLGVRLGDVMSFSDGTEYPQPMYYGKDMMMAEGDFRATASVPASIPKGENTITSDVSITFEIK